jgi:hypothetical protein
LRYANRAKNIKNKPKINEDPKDTMIREFKEEIERLRKMLSDQAAGGHFQVPAVAAAAPAAANTSAAAGASGAVVSATATGPVSVAQAVSQGAPVIDTSFPMDGFHSSSTVTVKNDEVDFTSTAPIPTHNVRTLPVQLLLIFIFNMDPHSQLFSPYTFLERR